MGGEIMYIQHCHHYDGMMQKYFKSSLLKSTLPPYFDIACEIQ